MSKSRVKKRRPESRAPRRKIRKARKSSVGAATSRLSRAAATPALPEARTNPADLMRPNLSRQVGIAARLSVVEAAAGSAAAPKSQQSPRRREAAGSTPAVRSYSFDELLNRHAKAADLHTILYIHVPKTGGNTINRLLAQNDYSEVDWSPKTNDFFECIDEQCFFSSYENGSYRSEVFLTGHFRLDHSIFRRIQAPHVVVTTLRHPLSIIQSTYNFTLRRSDAPWHAEVISGRMSLLELAINLKSAFGPQYSWFDDTGRGVVTPTGGGNANQCLNNLLTRVSFYGFTENLTEFAITLGYLMGFDNILPVNIVNRTQDHPDLTGTPLRESLSHQEQTFLADLLRDDIWFYERAREEYDRRLSDPRLRKIIELTAPLAKEAHETMVRFQSIGDPADPGRRAFQRRCP